MKWREVPPRAIPRMIFRGLYWSCIALVCLPFIILYLIAETVVRSIWLVILSMVSVVAWWTDR